MRLLTGAASFNLYEAGSIGLGVNVAEGLSAVLGDAIVDGVEVRHRQAVARPDFVTDPVTASPVCMSPC